MFELFFKVCKQFNLTVFDEKEITLNLVLLKLSNLYDLNSNFCAKYNQWLKLQSIYDYDPDDKLYSLEYSIKCIELEIYLIQTYSHICYHNNPPHRNNSDKLLLVTELNKISIKNSIKNDNQTLSVLLPNHYIYRDPYKNDDIKSSLFDIRSIQLHINEMTDKLKNIELHEKKFDIALNVDSIEYYDNINPLYLSPTHPEVSPQNIYIDFLYFRRNNAESYLSILMNKSILCQKCFEVIDNKKSAMNCFFKYNYDARIIQRNLVREQITILLQDLIDIFQKNPIDNHKKRLRP